MTKKKSRNRNRIGQIALGIVQKFYPKVDSVTDADDDLLINVTEKDYKTSMKKSHGGCALAVATKRQEAATSVLVSSSTAYVIKGTSATRYKVPGSASREIVSFDRGAEFCAGDYKLKAITKSARLGARSGREGNRDKDRSSNGNMVKRFSHKTANIREDLKAKT